MRTTIISFVISLSIVTLAAPCRADIRLAPKVCDGMVLPTMASCPITGSTDPGAKIAVQFRGKKFEATAAKNGQFQIELASGKAGGPFAMTIEEIPPAESATAPSTTTAESTTTLSTEPASPYVINSVYVGSDWVRPAGVIGDGMVLQQQTHCPIWGTAKAGSQVTLTFRDRTLQTTADDKGQFRIDVPSGSAGGPFEMRIEGANKILFKHIYVGEVWVCSGQSNMEMAVGKLSGQEAAAHLEGVVQLSTPDGWREASADSIPTFSAVGFYFGDALSKDLKVPIGLIWRFRGGSEAERWVPPEMAKKMGLTADDMTYSMDGAHTHYYGAEQKPKIVGDIYEGMIKPLQPYAIRGVIWYQGESSFGASSDWYAKVLGGLITGWRQAWGQGDFPFLVVQLPRIYMNDPWKSEAAPPWTGASAGDGWCYVRDAQRRVLSLPNTGLAVIVDVSDGGMHPTFKKPVSARLALVARGAVYKEPIEYCGPLVNGWKLNGNQLVLSFDHADGLTTGSAEINKGPVHETPGDLKVTDVCVVDAAGKKSAVDAKIDGNTVVVDMQGHDDAVTLYYSGQAWPKGNLYNKALLPASPFRLVLKPDQLNTTNPASAPAN